MVCVWGGRFGDGELAGCLDSRWPRLLPVLLGSPSNYLERPVGFAFQGDVVLQSEFVIETLTKIAICANKVNNVNINQGR